MSLSVDVEISLSRDQPELIVSALAGQPEP
jgi:hypothetical protein